MRKKEIKALPQRATVEVLPARVEQRADDANTETVIRGIR